MVFSFTAILICPDISIKSIIFAANKSNLNNQ